MLREISSSGNGKPAFPLRPEGYPRRTNGQDEEKSVSVRVEGGRFLPVATPEGERYTRGGKFQIPENKGSLTLGGQGQATVPPDAKTVLVMRDGQVMAMLDGGKVSKVGRVSLVSFANPDRLAPAGRNLLAPTPESGPPELFAPRDAKAAAEEQKGKSDEPKGQRLTNLGGLLDLLG